MSTIKKIFYHGTTVSMKQDLLSKVKLIKNLQQQKNMASLEEVGIFKN